MESMQELLPVNANSKSGAVNARDLHKMLGVGKHFGSWIKERIEKYHFVENEDFEVFPENGKNLLGGRPKKEYALSLDMAKMLCMVENNEMGMKIRKYFIEVEEKYKAITFNIPKTFSEALLLAANQQIELEKQSGLLNNVRLELAESEHKLKVCEDVVSKTEEDIQFLKSMFNYKGDNGVTVTIIANQYGMLAKEFNKLLNSLGIIKKVSGKWMIAGKYIDKGYMVSVPYIKRAENGNVISRQVRYNWSQTGVRFLYQYLKERGVLPLNEHKAS